MTPAPGYVEHPPLVLRLSPVIDMTDEQFYEFCRVNRDLRIERTADGDLLIMTPAGGRTGNRNAEITLQLQQWAKRNGQGVAFDSSTGFRLPNVVISPFSKVGYVDHTPIDTTAILKLIELRFQVSSLTARDNVQPDISQLFFDFTNKPNLTPPTPPSQPTSGPCYITSLP